MQIITEFALFLKLMLFLCMRSIQCHESSQANNKFLTMRMVSPTCDLKQPVKSAIFSIEDQVQNLTTRAEIRELRQYLKDEIATNVEEILHILLNTTGKGRDGRDASLRDSPGKPGEPRPAGPPGANGTAGGVVFTRWGRKHCPQTSGTNELYSGVIGGSWYHYTGGASNYLCLPLNPIFDKITSGAQGYSYIYGTEYEVINKANIFSKALHHHDATCAVCYTESRGSHLMIPARNVCPSGWTLEYKGYLMSAHQGHNGRTQFICVDGNPESTTGSHSDKNGALLYLVESHCGSLPCPPYGTGKELTCVVCTK